MPKHRNKRVVVIIKVNKSSINRIPLKSEIKQEVKNEPGGLSNLAKDAIAVESNATLVNFDSTAIKREDTTKIVPASFDEAPDELPYYYACNQCGKRFSSSSTVLKHRSAIHKIMHSKHPKIKYMHLEPDVNDPDNRCRACETAYRSKGAYRMHLKTVHHLIPKKVFTSLLRPRNNIAPDPEDPNHYCRSCQRTYSSKDRYKAHLLTFHSVKVSSLTSIKRPETLPNVDDPNLHCSLCNHTYKVRHWYTKHCQVIHGIRATRKSRVAGMPDLKDPKNHCKVCNFTFKYQSSYRTHCRKVHEIERARFANPNDDPDIADPNNFCKTCDRRFASKRGYRAHLSVVHHITLTKQCDTLAKQCDKQPDINDPDNYCCCCDRTLSTKKAYNWHLFTKHSKPQPNLKKGGVGSNNQCGVCQKRFPSRAFYRSHLERTQHMRLDPTTLPLKTSTLLPDPHDPSFCCRVCGTTKETRWQYRHHCKTKHLMVLDYHTIKDSNAVIDVNSPEWYCAQCKHFFGRKSHFESHLKTIHHIDMKARNIDSM